MSKEISRAMTPPVDYAEPTDTAAQVSAQRRSRHFWRCVWTLTGILFALSAWDFTNSVLDHFDRVEQAKRAVSIQKVQR